MSVLYVLDVDGTVADLSHRKHHPGRELVMVDDYGAVRRAVEEAGFRTRHAPDCWSEAW